MSERIGQSATEAFDEANSAPRQGEPQAEEGPSTWTNKWLVLRKRATDPWEVYAFTRYDEAALSWDASQAQWSDVFFCRVAACEGAPLDITPVVHGFKDRVDKAEAEVVRLREERDALRAHHRLCQCPVDGYDHEDCVFRLSAAEARASLAALSTALEGLEKKWRIDATAYEISSKDERSDGDFGCAGREAARAEILITCADRLAALQTLEAEK